MAKASIFLLMFMLSLTVTLAQQPVLSCGDTTGRIERAAYDSSVLKAKLFYTIYLPPCYDSTETEYPVIYLLHGSNEDDGHWVRLGLPSVLDDLIVMGEAPPVIVIMPFGDVLANRNRFDDLSWENVFLHDLMPYVEAAYRIDARPERRAVGGVSRGGFWAFEIALRHPNLFSAVGGHSAFFDLYHASAEYNPMDLAVNAPGIENLRLWLDRGIDDYAAPNLDIMADRLRRRRLDYVYTVYPEGQHANSYWSQHLADYIRFYTAAWGEGADSVQAATALQSETGLALFLPVVSFPSLQTTVSRATLQAIFDGQPVSNLVLGDVTASTLREFGVGLSSDIRIVPQNAVFNTLWSNRRLYTLLPFDQLTPRYRVLNVDELHPLDGDLTRYPFAFETDAPNFYPNRLTRFLLSGVTALARGTREALDEHGVEWAGEAILPYVTRPDFFHTSNEVSIYPTCPDTAGDLLGGMWSMCSKADHFKLLTDLDVDIVELTGNHNSDYGFGAYLDTLDFYRDNGILTVGGGATLEEARQPLLIDHNGNRIAMVACNWIGPVYALANDEKAQPGAAYCDWNWLKTILPQLAAQNDLLIVTVQYQEFEEYTPNAKQQADFRLLARLGADVVVGTQAHKPQTFEFFDAGRDDEVFIHYGLGNLFFDQEFWGNQRFFMDQLFIYEGRLLTVDVFTGIIEDQGRPRPMDATERENFLFFMLNQQNGF